MPRRSAARNAVVNNSGQARSSQLVRTGRLQGHDDAVGACGAFPPQYVYPRRRPVVPAPAVSPKRRVPRSSSTTRPTPISVAGRDTAGDTWQRGIDGGFECAVNECAFRQEKIKPVHSSSSHRQDIRRGELPRREPIAGAHRRMLVRRILQASGTAPRGCPTARSAWHAHRIGLDRHRPRSRRCRGRAHAARRHPPLPCTGIPLLPGAGNSNGCTGAAFDGRSAAIRAAGAWEVMLSPNRASDEVAFAGSDTVSSGGSVISVAASALESA